MAIVASNILADVTQVDGRRYILVRHVDQFGSEYIIHRLVAANFDVSGSLAQDAIIQYTTRVNSEIATNIFEVISNGSLATIKTNYSTNAANMAALRRAYAVSNRQQAIMIGDFLSTLTNAALQNLLGLTAGQVTTLRTNKLTPAANAAAAIRAATGQ